MSSDKKNILKAIIETKHEEIRLASSIRSQRDLEDELKIAPKIRDFESAIMSRVREDQVAVIAEIKKASPSKGVIREDFDPIDIAQSYESHGAACLSVLTDKQYFMGAHEYLVAARDATGLPVLRKDFMVDPYQIYEARCLGADCILLIVAALSEMQMVELEEVALELGMSILVEAHSHQELEFALNLKTPLIGVNNRDLKTFDTSLQTSLDLLNYIPNDRTLITESGIHTAADVNRMRDSGIHAFLVGEAFMRAPNPGVALKSLFS